MTYKFTKTSSACPGCTPIVVEWAKFYAVYAEIFRQNPQYRKILLDKTDIFLYNKCDMRGSIQCLSERAIKKVRIALRVNIECELLVFDGFCPG